MTDNNEKHAIRATPGVRHTNPTPPALLEHIASQDTQTISREEAAAINEDYAQRRRAILEDSEDDNRTWRREATWQDMAIILAFLACLAVAWLMSR